MNMLEALGQQPVTRALGSLLLRIQRLIAMPERRTVRLVLPKP
jgi:hypothetical protein